MEYSGVRMIWDLELDQHAKTYLDTRLKGVDNLLTIGSDILRVTSSLLIARWKRHNDEMVVFLPLSLNLSLKLPTTLDCVNVFLIKNGLDTSY